MSNLKLKNWEQKEETGRYIPFCFYSWSYKIRSDAVWVTNLCTNRILMQCIFWLHVRKTCCHKYIWNGLEIYTSRNSISVRNDSVTYMGTDMNVSTKSGATKTPKIAIRPSILVKSPRQTQPRVGFRTEGDYSIVPLAHNFISSDGQKEPEKRLLLRANYYWKIFSFFFNFLKTINNFSFSAEMISFLHTWSDLFSAFNNYRCAK